MISGTQKTELIIKRHQGSFTGLCLSDSMWPLFYAGDKLIITAATSTTPYQVGDIVAFYDDSKQKIMIHRLVALNPKIITTKGDHLLHSDPPHPRSALIGKVTQLHNYYGRFKVETWWHRLFLVAALHPDSLGPHSRIRYGLSKMWHRLIFMFLRLVPTVQSIS